jgi:radical SAM enzyme (rSAM/lipoprotein system)
MALELSRVLTRNERREHPLQQLFWECTVRCNIHCRHCGSDCRQSATTPDMPREDFFRVLDSISRKTDPREVLVIISGGEPLVREDIVECAQGIHDRGFAWGMVSNGLYMTAERYAQLCDAGLRSLTISLDGLEPQHTWLRRHPDCFRMADQAIDRVVADGDRIAYDVMTCVHQRNYGHLPALRDHLISKGVSHWRLATIFPVGRGAEDEQLRLNGGQFRGLLDFIRQTRKEGRIHASYGCEGYLSRYEGEVRDWPFHCAAGVTVGSVLVDGSISACTSIRHNYKQGNIYEDDFMDVWERRFAPHRNHRWMKRDECSHCKHWRYCEGNGLHLRDDDGRLLFCHIRQLEEN